MNVHISSHYVPHKITLERASSTADSLDRWHNRLPKRKIYQLHYFENGNIFEDDEHIN